MTLSYFYIDGDSFSFGRSRSYILFCYFLFISCVLCFCERIFTSVIRNIPIKWTFSWTFIFQIEKYIFCVLNKVQYLLCLVHMMWMCVHSVSQKRKCKCFGLKVESKQNLFVKVVSMSMYSVKIIGWLIARQLAFSMMPFAVIKML